MCITSGPRFDEQVAGTFVQQSKAFIPSTCPCPLLATTVRSSPPLYDVYFPLSRK